jgi:hypothetical protein
VTRREHMQAIYAEYGKLTPEIVVEVARPKNHPLHAAVFDKAPREAAEAYYRTRAQELIRSVRVAYKTPEGGVRDMREFFAVRPEHGSEEYVYEPAEKIAADPISTEILLRDMEREWRQMFERYSRFKEFVELVRSTLADEVQAA